MDCFESEETRRHHCAKWSLRLDRASPIKRGQLWGKATTALAEVDAIDCAIRWCSRRAWPFVYPVNLSKKDVFPLALQGLARLAAIVQGWRAAFPACNDPDRWLDDAAKQIADYRKALGISSHQLEASIDPSMKIYPGYMNERALREAVAEARDA